MRKKISGPFGVATFHGTHSVLKAEKILKEAGLEGVRLIPVPSQISSDCGVTVRFLLADAVRARTFLAPLHDDLEGFFAEADEGWTAIPE